MEGIIKILSNKLKGVDYAFTGSFNMSLQGIDIDFYDIDILTNDFGIKKIAKIFNSKIINKEKYLEIYFKINNLPIHVFSVINNPLRKKDFKKHIIIVEKYNQKLPATDLKEELRVYKSMNRKGDQDKIKMIKEFINKIK